MFVPKFDAPATGRSPSPPIGRRHAAETVGELVAGAIGDGDRTHMARSGKSSSNRLSIE